MNGSEQAPTQLSKSIAQLKVHDHPCLVHETPAEKLAVVAPFIRIGLERGERCLYLAPENGARAILEELATGGIDTASALADGMLLMPNVHGIYRREEPFTPDRVLDFLRQAIDEAGKDGLAGLRLVGEMPWTLEGTTGTEPLIEYEARLNDFILDHDLPALCVYDRNCFPPEVLLDVFRTHPKVISGYAVSRSYSYLPPDDFFLPRRAAVEVEHLLRGMLADEKLLAALEERNALLGAVMENSPDIIYVKDLEGRYLMINPAGTTALGRPADQVLGHSDGEFFPPDAVARSVAADRRALACGEPFNIEETLTVAGTPRTFSTTRGSYHDAKGKVIGLFGIARDITEHKSLEKALLQSEEQFRTLCDSAPIGIFRTDSEGNNIYCNPRWEEIAGMSAAEGLGRGWIRVIHPEDRAELGRIWLEAKSSGRIYSHEHRQVTPQGKTIWVRALANPIKGQDDAILGYVGTVEDVTELRQARQELLKAHKLESLGVLAGGIAHDFNNILTAVLGNIALARLQLDEPEKVTKRLEDAEKATIRARDLTHQLLTFARGGEPVKRIVQLSGLLREAAGFALHGSTVTGEFHLADNIWPVEADEGQLSQVVHNLVLNAVQAMPEGGTVTISTANVSSTDNGKRFVKISVADTGLGIPEHDLQRIFDPYFTTKEQGSGLGLATCYSIIKKHGGEIVATSIPGKGSTFRVFLPAAEHAGLAETISPTEVTRGSGRILVMDDEEEIRVLAKTMLEELGYTVECVADGAKAVELYRERKARGNPFSAVVLDLSIPGGVGGRETIESLLKIDPQVKAIVSSGYSTDPVMANYRDYGFSAVLSKPYRPQELGRVMTELLHRAEEEMHAMESDTDRMTGRSAVRADNRKE